jgi:hypothetical protein
VNRSKRNKQDAVIVMAIIVVILALWRLHSRSNQLGGIGAWAGTNIFGSNTLSLLSGGSEPGAGGHPPQDGPTNGSTNASSGSSPIRTNAAMTTSSPPPVIESLPGSNQTLSTNLLHTNGPVTEIAVMPSDLAETPPGVTAASNVPDAATIARRLGEVGAKGGDIQISLFWKNFNDLDLHCIDPGGEEIWFNNRRSHVTGGELDVDQNAQAPYNTSPVENINWPLGAAPRGPYRIYVVHYALHGGNDPTAFTVRTVVRGRTNFYSSTITFSGLRERKLVCTFQY